MLALVAVAALMMSRPPQPLNLAAIVTADDYPAAARRWSQQGRAVFRLMVGSNGRPVECTIIVSSGFEVLDIQTCDLVLTRARFNPAVDARGKPVTGSYSSAIVWCIAPLPDAPKTN